MPTDVLLPPSGFRESRETRDEAPAGRTRWWWVLASVAVAAAVTLHVFSAWGADAPRTPWDENHVLQMARWISGDHNVTPMSGDGYYPGWSVMMAPIWWFTHDAATVYAAALGLGIVVAILTIVPLAMTAREWGVSTPQAISAAAVVMCLPARVVNADYVLAEKPLLFLLAWTLWAAVAVWKRPTWWRMLLLATFANLTYLVHARALTVVIVVAIWMVLFIRRQWVLVLVGLPALVVGVLAVREYSASIHEHVLISGFGQGSGVLAKLSESTGEDILRVLLTQLWAQFIGTAGLFALGLIIVMVWAWRELRRFSVGIGGFLLGLTLATVAMSVISWAGSPDLAPLPDVRFDASIYTRYIDPLAALVALVALTALIRVASRNVLLTALALAAIISALVVFWIAPFVPTWGNLNGPANSAAILSWDRFFPTGQVHDVPLVPAVGNPNRWWLYASVFLIAALIGCLIFRRRPPLLVSVGLVVIVALSVNADQTQGRDYPNDITEAVEAVEAETGDPVSLDLSTDCRDSSLGIHQMINWVPYWLSPREVTLVSLEDGESFRSEVVVACDWWPEASDFGAIRFAGGNDYGYRVWILPGDLQDRLVSSGELDLR